MEKKNDDMKHLVETEIDMIDHIIDGVNLIDFIDNQEFTCMMIPEIDRSVDILASTAIIIAGAYEDIDCVFALKLLTLVKTIRQEYQIYAESRG